MIALDERVSIVNMLFSGTLFKWIPIEGDSNRTWGSAHEHGNAEHDHQHVSVVFFEKYKEALHNCIEHADYALANDLIDDLHQFQILAASDYIPSENQRSLEIVLNNSQVFIRLAYLNLIVGYLYLVALFLTIFNKLKKGIKI